MVPNSKREEDFSRGCGAPHFIAYARKTHFDVEYSFLDIKTGCRDAGRDLALIKRQRPNLLGISVFLVLPGTYLFDSASAFDLKYDADNDMNVLSSFSFSEEDLNSMRDLFSSYVKSGSRFHHGDKKKEDGNASRGG